MRRLFAVAILAMGCTVANAQGSVTVDQLARATRQQQQQQQQGIYNHPATNYYSSDSQPFGTFYVEYNPTTVHYSHGGYSNNTNYQGISVGGNYFMPFAGSLGADFGLKLQYFFRNEDKSGIETKDNMLAATIPVNLAYDWHVTDGFVVYPYAGLFARFDISAQRKIESGKSSKKYNPFSKDDMGDDTYNRFQFGWQAGVNFRISDIVTIGGGYWMDLNELTDDIKTRGFNIQLGVNF